jgi:phosphatidylglycerophosphate synthase
MTWTYIGFFFPILGFVCVVLNYAWLGIVFFLLGGLLDEIDGKVARWTGRTTYWGGFVDGTVDRFTDFFFILSFYYLGFEPWIVDISLILLILLFVTIMPPFIVAYANHRKAVPDPTEKVIWRFSFRGEYYVLFILVLLFSELNLTLAFYIMLGALLLNGVTVVQSLILAFIKAKDYPQQPPSSPTKN